MNIALLYFGTGAFFALVMGIGYGLRVKNAREEDLTSGLVGLVMLLTFLAWPAVIPACLIIEAKGTYGYNPIERMVLAPDERGYWLCDSQRRRYPFGSAFRYHFNDGKELSYEPDNLVVTVNGRVLTADDVQSFGDVYQQELMAPIVGVVRLTEYDGYYIFTQAGEVFHFGAASFYGSLVLEPQEYHITWPGYKNNTVQAEEEHVLPMSAKPAPI